ncbi:very-long-chain-(S)-2-hydroxy-acid oxidase [Aureococcus anophagefferens]|nr:very-long-chain-(S)-2-hydroxy-acid oxidase [Aureococcus anophagefferens]
MAPAWTWDLLSSDPYTYANIDEDVPAEALAAFVNAQLACDFDWDDARWLVGEWKRLRPGGTIALKGVVRPDDAARGTWASTASGSGTDIASAGPGRVGRRRRQALPRPGAGGKAGVDKCFDVLDAELRTCMGLLGVRTVAELRSTAATSSGGATRASATRKGRDTRPAASAEAVGRD